jgi:hypothetical protein
MRIGFCGYASAAWAGSCSNAQRIAPAMGVRNTGVTWVLSEQLLARRVHVVNPLRELADCDIETAPTVSIPP